MINVTDGFIAVRRLQCELGHFWWHSPHVAYFMQISRIWTFATHVNCGFALILNPCSPTFMCGRIYCSRFYMPYWDQKNDWAGQREKIPSFSLFQHLLTRSMSKNFILYWSSISKNVFKLHLLFHSIKETICRTFVISGQFP